MRVKNSLFYRILAILIAVAGVTLLIGFYVNLDALHDALKTREQDKAKAIYHTVTVQLQTEIRELSTLSQILGKNDQLVNGLRVYQQQGDRAPLQKIMDQLYPALAHIGVDCFLVADNHSKIAYQPALLKSDEDIHQIWGIEEVLAGQDLLSAGYGPRGWAIRSLSPLAPDPKPQGVLILGIYLTDVFAKKIAEATNTNISFGSPYKIIASSWPPQQQERLDPARINEAIQGKKSLFSLDHTANISSLYIPISIVDETLCLIIDADTTQMAELLQQKRRHLFLSFLGVIVAILFIGSGLTFSIVRPLQNLQNRALAFIKEFSQEDVVVSWRGNEIATLSQAMELMLAAIQKNLAELLQTQASLRERELFLSSVFTSIQDGLIVLDKDLTIVRVNPAIERLFSHLSPLEGQKCYAVFYGRAEPCEACHCRQAMETRNAVYQSKSMPCQTRDQMAWVDSFAFPLQDLTTGQVIGVIEYIRDVTEQKKTENALRQQEERLRQAAKMEAVGRLAGGVAHDFNNILTAIIGECELLMPLWDKKDPIRHQIQVIHQAALRAASLTRQLLAFSRKQVLEPRFLDINTTLADMDKMLRRILGEDIDLVTVLEPDLGTVQVDPSQIEQVVLNLSVNARDAMPQGGKLTLETANLYLDEDYARGHPEIQPGPYVMVAVSDTGVGLDEISKSHIFEPFFTTKNPGQGTGLGLSMVYGIVKQSGGHIWVYSEPGQGTTFKIYFPRMDQPAESAPPPHLPEIDAPVQGIIMVVEDEDMVRRVVCRMLARQGYTLLAAANGPEALRLCEEHRGAIDLLLTDVIMPGINGSDLADRLRARFPHLAVLFMSGYTENAIVHHGVLDPGTAFIHKPFRHESLAAKVREVLMTRTGTGPENPVA